MGITMDPREETSATADPEIPPKNMLSMTLTMASPPGSLPTIRLAKLTIFWEMPPSFMISPIMIKKGIASREKFMTPSAMVFTTASKGTLK